MIEEQNQEMTLQEAEEAARKAGRIEEFQEMVEEGWSDPIAIMATMDLPFTIGGQEFRAGAGPIDPYGTGEGWKNLLDIAKQFATGKGLESGPRWLEDAFEEYFQDHEEAVEEGDEVSFGGQTFSEHNRKVLAEKIANELGNGVGGHHVLTEKQLEKLKDFLQEVAENPRMENGLSM